MSRKTQTWRLIRHQPAPGAENMAIDEAILESVARRAAPPTLRLYAWDPPCLSLGLAQSTSQVDREALAALGWGMVRRPTGGRGILHTCELTYSVMVPYDNPHVSGGVLSSYRHLSMGLVSGLEILGLQVEITPEINLSEEQRSQAVCFQVASSYEITVGSRKLVGSAQLRRVDAVLQHGSIPLTGDIGLICRGLQYPTEAERAEAAMQVREHAVTLEELLGREVPWCMAAQAIVEGFARALEIELAEGELSPHELSRSRELISERYDNTSWTDRVR